MPELPDITVYVERLGALVGGAVLERVRLGSPFVLRSADPPLPLASGRRVAATRRLGKRVVIELEGELFLVIHLMIAGRLHWKARGAALARRNGLAAFDFSTGTLLLTEASTKKRASLHLVAGAAGLAAHDPGGLEVLEADLPAFREALVRERHTLKRALTDPHLFSGIGNWCSDEILHRARLSPAALTGRLAPEEIETLRRATLDTLSEWTERLRAAAGLFPEPKQVTAFHPEMAVHGRYGQPFPICGEPVQRIRYADHETNYCARCQTGGKLLSDRALSRLLKQDCPRTLAELEDLKAAMKLH